MSHAFRILEFLEDIAPRAQCDDCLSTALHIEPRQTINITCRKLAADGRVERVSYRCAQCDKAKLVNSFRADVTLPREFPASTSIQDPKRLADHADHHSIDIEKARTQVVRICRDLWAKHQGSEPPRGLAAMIAELRNADILPTHIANMMLTLAGLRNVHVYEGISLDSRALAIAANAQSIIREWSDSKGSTK